MHERTGQKLVDELMVLRKRSGEGRAKASRKRELAGACQG